MIEALLLEYKRLLEERKASILELDGFKVESILRKEEEVLSKLEDELSRLTSLSPSIKSLTEEVYTLHDEVAKLTFNMIEALSEGANDEHLFNVQHR